MNGYTLMAESYKKLMNESKIEKEIAEKEIRIYEFLATCNEDDFFRIIDSGAFNDIIRAYVKESVVQADIDEKSKEKVLAQAHWIFDTKNAKEILSNYK